MMLPGRTSGDSEASECRGSRCNHPPFLQPPSTLKAYHSISAARADIAEYISGYNATRPHSRLAEATPDEHYFALLPTMAVAA